MTIQRICIKKQSRKSWTFWTIYYYIFR